MARSRSAERSRRSLGYTVLQMALAFFFLALFNVPSLEATRILLYTEFGLLLGRRRGPGLDKLRRFLKSVQAVERSEAFVLNVVKGFVLGVAYQLIAMGVVDWEILYLDGHFIPYFGRHLVRKGYFTVRRLAMKGHQAYYANDPQGRPFFFLPTPASDQLTAVIPRMIAQALYCPPFVLGPKDQGSRTVSRPSSATVGWTGC